MYICIFWMCLESKVYKHAHYCIFVNMQLTISNGIPCFTPVELKKQSTCSIQMINKTDHHVAFKVLAVFHVSKFSNLVILFKLE